MQKQQTSNAEKTTAFNPVPLSVPIMRMSWFFSLGGNRCAIPGNAYNRNAAANKETRKLIKAPNIKVAFKVPKYPSVLINEIFPDAVAIPIKEMIPVCTETIHFDHSPNSFSASRALFSILDSPFKKHYWVQDS